MVRSQRLTVRGRSSTDRMIVRKERLFLFRSSDLSQSI